MRRNLEINDSGNFSEEEIHTHEEKSASPSQSETKSET